MCKGTNYSQIYISDKLTVKSNPYEHTLIDHIYKDINTPNDQPWIAIALDMGVKSSQLKVTVDSDSTLGKRKLRETEGETPTCWRIYAAGSTEETYPFLSSTVTEFPLEKVFGDIVTQGFNPPPYEEMLQPLRDKMEFGLSTGDRHMKWEEK